MLEAWDKLPKESSKAYALFCLYRDMGPDRSIAKVKRLSIEGLSIPSKTQLLEYSGKYNWVSRAAAWDLAMQKHKELAMKNAIEELARRQVERGTALAEEGMKYLRKPKRKPLTAAEARMYIVDGSELERIALGLTDERSSRQPQTIRVIISAPRPGRPLPERRQLEAGNATDREVLEGEAIEVAAEECR
jgi:hypothetical protein